MGLLTNLKNWYAMITDHTFLKQKTTTTYLQSSSCTSSSEDNDMGRKNKNNQQTEVIMEQKTEAKKESINYNNKAYSICNSL